MRRLSVTLLAAIVSAPALAADVPNIVGTWTPQESASARVGVSDEFAAPIDPVALNAPESAWTWQIEGQDGRAFHGQVTGPTGKSQALVGVFTSDGTRFHAATKNGTAVGEIVEGGFEMCWSDALADMVAVDCTRYGK